MQREGRHDGTCNLARDKMTAIIVYFYAFLMKSNKISYSRKWQVYAGKQQVIPTTTHPH